MREISFIRELVMECSLYNLVVIFAVFGLILFIPSITRLYLQTFNLPPGPLPLPFVGNTLEFRGIKIHPILRINEFRDRFGPVFTLWLGTQPFVFIYDLRIAKNLFHKLECSGRPKSFLGDQILLTDNSTDIIFQDYTQAVILLRKVAISSARTISKSRSFSTSICELVDQTVEQLTRTSFGNSISPEEHIYDLNLKVGLLVAFGKIFNESDVEFKTMRYFFHEFMHQNVLRMGLWEFSPIFRYWDRNIIIKLTSGVKKALDIIKLFLNKNENKIETDVPNFCREFISAKNNAILENKQWEQHLTEENMARSIFDLFIAGVETTNLTLRWVLLFICYYPEIQQKLRKEIELKIGARIPEYEDRHHCHYVMAFIAEILRFKNVNPLGLYHKTSTDLEIGKHVIPKGTGLFVSQYSILNDEEHWTDEHQFRPERFLSDGQYIKNKSNAFIPFGVGRRTCVGEKIAVNDLFLMLVRFLQKTQDYNIELNNDSGLEPNPEIFFEFSPKYYEISFKQKENQLNRN